MAKDKISLDDYIVNLETSISNLSPETQNEIGNKICNITDSILKTKYKKQHEPLQLTNRIRETKIFTKNNQDLIITTADKSNKTVILPKPYHNQKTNKVINGPNT